VTPRVLLIDNYDSFTCNLAQGFLTLGADVETRFNNAVTPAEARLLSPTHLVISPGPGAPSRAGVSRAMIAAFASDIPILGVCLGHQAIVEVFGGTVTHAPQPVHGKAAAIRHDGMGVFRDLPLVFEAGRYHSLAADPSRLPPNLEISATSDDGVVMGVRHRTLPVEGVQFHPESVLTPQGQMILRNFLETEHAS
jgi:anthranilate synthase/aminodeoxychorismate synthase-like glutamine amidotransferase